MKFSERKGYEIISTDILRTEINDTLRNGIWNIVYLLKWKINFVDYRFNIDHQNNNLGKNSIGQFSSLLWYSYFRLAIDDRPSHSDDMFSKIRDYFFGCQWYEFYDFLEFVLTYYEDKKLNDAVNFQLEKELSGYRFINGQITDITDKQEIEMLEVALNDENFPNVKAHLQRALELLSDRKNPDYRNSIKESISAVESIAKEIAQKPKADLGAALSAIEKQGKLHRAMKSAFLSLYGYTSDADGIRHALMEEQNLTADDAKFFLLSCTSFINYLKAKM